MRVALLGVGRMGRAVTRVATEAGHTITAAVDHGETVGRDVGELAGVGPIGVSVADRLDALRDADVIIDFSLPEVARELFTAAASWGVPLVTGTTGFDARAALVAVAAEAPVVAAANFSQGVTVLAHLCRLAAAALPDFDAEITEIHHRRKVDAPSGTAGWLAEAVEAARPDTARLHGRSGQVGARTDAEMAVLALRGGDVVGEHTLFLFGEGERVELSHRATDRTIFARGAVRAAEWAIGRAPGLYDMPEVLGLAT